MVLLRADSAYYGRPTLLAAVKGGARVSATVPADHLATVWPWKHSWQAIFDATLGPPAVATTRPAAEPPARPNITWNIPEKSSAGIPPRSPTTQGPKRRSGPNASPIGGFRRSGTPGSGIVGRPTVGALSGTSTPFAVVPAPDGALLAGAANPTATAGREEQYRACDDRASGLSAG
jgi:hypothetical protein